VKVEAICDEERENLRATTERTRIALLLAISVVVYANSLFNQFTYDDDVYIVRNPVVTNLSIKGLFEPAKANTTHRFFRPVTFASYQMNRAIGGANPFGYHLVNLLLHAAVTWLLFLVLKKLLEQAPQGATIAWVAALLFAVHPIHTEAVTSVVGRSELLAAGFLLAAWLLHLEDRPVASLICFALALLSKESAIAFVPLALAGDYARGKFKPAYRYVAIVGVAAIYAIVLWKAQGFAEKTLFLNNPLATLPADLRILNALRIGWKYVGLMVYPASLVCDYSYNSIPLYATWAHLAPALIAWLIVFGLWAWTFLTGRTAWFLVGAIYFAGFAVTANVLLPTGTIMGERLAYLPSAGFCLLLPLLWARLEAHQSKLAWALLLLVVSAMSVRTVVRNRDWHDNFALFSAGVRAVPENAKLQDGLGGEYILRGRPDLAAPHLDAAFRIYPNVPEANEADFRMVYLAANSMKVGETNDALKFMDVEISRSPQFSPAWSQRAVLYYKMGDPAMARDDAQTALRLDAGNLQAQYLLNALEAGR
jgi:protein O-mannosyl-transferase